MSRAARRGSGERGPSRFFSPCDLETADWEFGVTGLSLRGSDRARLTSAFEGLADGGQVAMPLIDQPWGEAGWLKDKFGITWNVDVQKS